MKNSVIISMNIYPLKTDINSILSKTEGKNYGRYKICNRTLS